MVKESKRPNILFGTNDRGTFIDLDLKTLQKNYQVSTIKFVGYGVGQVWEILHKVSRNQVIVLWFMSPAAVFTLLIGKLLGRKSIVIIGGIETARCPEINYGDMRFLSFRIINRFGLWLADRVIAQSKFAFDEIDHYCDRSKIRLIYNAVDTEFYYPDGVKENIVITAAVPRPEDPTGILKGIPTFVECARALPQYCFILLGMVVPGAPPNLTCVPFTNNKFVIRDYYRKARIYCQLSYRENFGYALAEAMACGCIPVVTNRGALPDVSGRVGTLTDYASTYETVWAIEKAFNKAAWTIPEAHVREWFSTVRREQELVNLITEVNE